MSKHAALLLIIILTVSSLIVAKAISASASVPKPSVPEFTLRLVEHPYYVAPVATIDPYTGKSVTIEAGHYVQNKSIEVTIKNQLLAHSSDGETYRIYYNVRTKGHFEEDWTELYPVFDRPNSRYDWDNKSWSYSKYVYDKSPPQSNADFTVLSLSAEYPPDAQVDFQVEAIIGHDSQAWVIEHPLTPEYGGYYEPAIAFDAASDWTDTQTITLPAPTPSPSSPSPTSTPNQTTEPTSEETPQTVQWGAIVGMVIAVVVVHAGLLIYFRKRQSRSTKKSAFVLISFLMFGFLLTGVASANPLPPYKPPAVTVSSPSPAKTYNVTVIPLMVTIQVFAYTYQSIEQISWLSYSLDGQTVIPITLTYPREYAPGYYVDGSGTLSGLSNGKHTLVIQGETTFNELFNKSVSFNVDTTIPTVSVLSPTSKTYTTTHITLQFAVSEVVSWVGYALDGQEAVTIAGNTTLPGLSDGTHGLAVCAKDAAGNTGTSEIIHFLIDATAPSFSVLSPENKTYAATKVPLNLTVSEAASQITYSLDGQGNVTTIGNTTLAGFSAGAHNLTVYVTDLAGNTGASGTIYFSIEPSPPISVTALTVSSVAAIGLGSLVYFKKHQKSQSS